MIPGASRKRALTPTQLLTKPTQDSFLQITEQIIFKGRPTIPGGLHFFLPQTLRITTAAASLFTQQLSSARVTHKITIKRQRRPPVGFKLHTNLHTNHPLTLAFLIRDTQTRKNHTRLRNVAAAPDLRLRRMNVSSSVY